MDNNQYNDLIIDKYFKKIEEKKLSQDKAESIFK